MQGANNYDPHRIRHTNSTRPLRSLRSSVGVKERPLYELFYSQVEGLVEFRRPAVVLGFGGEFAFLVAEVRPDHRHFHEGTEHSGRLPPQIVRRHH